MLNDGENNARRRQKKCPWYLNPVSYTHLADLAAQQAAEKSLTSGIHSMNMQMVDLDVNAVQRGALLREAKADEANYLLYIEKREQERSSDALDKKSIADVAIAVPAVVPALPAYSPVLVTLAGFIPVSYTHLDVYKRQVHRRRPTTHRQRARPNTRHAHAIGYPANVELRERPSSGFGSQSSRG